MEGSRFADDSGDYGSDSGRGRSPRTLALERMALSRGSPALKGTPCLDVDQNGGKSPVGFCVSRPRNCASDARFFSAARSMAVRWWGFCGAAATDAEALERPNPCPACCCRSEPHRRSRRWRLSSPQRGQSLPLLPRQNARPPR